MVNRYARAGGQAMVELIIVAALVLVPLFLAIPVLGKYLDMRAAAVQTSRYAAWERTVWYGGDAATAVGIDFGWTHPQRWKANAKTDDQIRRELGVRQLSDNTSAFSDNDRNASDYKSAPKELWQDRSGTTFLAAYSNISDDIQSSPAPGTMSKALGILADVAATLGPFTLETNAKYTATVGFNVKDIDYDHMLAKTTSTSFSEKTVLLANGWSADGPTDDTKTSAKQQVKGLVPTTLFTGTLMGVPVMEYVQKTLSVILPEATKLELGKIDPEVVPADRLK